jgi:hypothetical protein
MVARGSDSFWVAHLLRRAGFGYTPAELARYKSLGYQGALTELLYPETIDNSYCEGRIRQQGVFDFSNPGDLKRWWMYRMLYTARPLEEKITLFWHGHFATADFKVRNPQAMYAQNQTLRRYALGNFNTLLQNVSIDPAMIVWLDNQQNVKGKPNENYAREIMELFTMGIGNYTEGDIKEAARAFTGWQTRNNAYYFNAAQHDEGTKSVLGVSGNLNGDDVINLLAKQKATARFLSKKLLKFFAYDDPDDAMVNKIADVYLSNTYQIRPMLKAIFTDPSFFSTKAYHAKVKSPVELVIGTLKTLQIQRIDGDLPNIMAAMGQNIFDPPSVKGWDGGPAWISSETMMERFNFATRISSEKFNEAESRFSPSQIVYRQGLKNVNDMVDYFLNLLVDNDVPASARTRLVEYVSHKSGGESAVLDERMLDAKLRGVVHLIMTLPSYQLS